MTFATDANLASLASAYTVQIEVDLSQLAARLAATLLNAAQVFFGENKIKVSGVFEIQSNMEILTKVDTKTGRKM